VQGLTPTAVGFTYRRKSMVKLTIEVEMDLKPLIKLGVLILLLSV